MNVRKSSMMALVAATLLAPALSMANTEWHQENNNQGFSYHPEHAKSMLSRAQVQGDARSAATSSIIREGAPLDTFPAATSPKTREQVRNEYLSMSAGEKQRMQAFLGGN